MSKGMVLAVAGSILSVILTACLPQSGSLIPAPWRQERGPGSADHPDQRPVVAEPRRSAEQTGTDTKPVEVPPVPAAAREKLRRWLAGYIEGATRESTPRHLAEWPIRGSLDWGSGQLVMRAFLAVDTARLSAIASWQPKGSPLLPYLRLAEGERRLEQGEAREGVRWWREVAALEEGSVASQMAARRLQAPNADQEFKVGLLFPMSGSKAVVGRSLLQSSRMVLQLYPELPLTLLVEDSGETPEQTRQGLEHLVAQGAKAVIGPVYHQQAKVAAKMVASTRLPLITLSPQSDVAEKKEGGGGASGLPNVYLNAYLPDQQARLMARYAIANQRGRAVVLAPESSYGDLMVQAFAAEFRRLGGQMVQVVTFPADRPEWPVVSQALSRPDRDGMSDRLKKLRAQSAPDKAALVVGDPTRELVPGVDFDVLYLPTRLDHARQAMAQLNADQADRRGQEGGWDRVMLLGSSLWSRSDTEGSGTEGLLNGVYCDLDEESRKAFRTVYRTWWGEDPDPLAPLAYDGVLAVAQLLREAEAGSLGEGSSWWRELIRPEGFRGAGGMTWRFQGNGHSQRQYRLYRLEAGRAVLLPPLKSEEP